MQIDQGEKPGFFTGNRAKERAFTVCVTEYNGSGKLETPAKPFFGDASVRGQGIAAFAYRVQWVTIKIDQVN